MYLSSHTNAESFYNVGPSTAEWVASSFATQQLCRPLYGMQSCNKKRYCLVQIVKVHSMSLFVYSVSGFCFKLEILYVW